MRAKALNDAKFKALLKYIGQIIVLAEDPTAAECERADGEVTLTVRPGRGGKGMLITYDILARYCCTCESDDAKCGECYLSGRRMGVYRDLRWRGKKQVPGRMKPGPLSRKPKRKKAKA